MPVMGVFAGSLDHLLWMLPSAAPGEPEAGPLIEEAHLRDLEQVRRIRDRDRKAIADFVQEHADAVYSYVRFRLAPRYEAADDVVQDVFLAAWQKLDTFRGGSPLRHWLLGIARHKIEDIYRQRLREPVPLPDGGDPDEIAADGEMFDEKIDRERLSRRAGEVLNQLPESYATVLLWRYWERIGVAEMAAKTGKTVKAIERLLSRARDAFGRRWQDGRR